jgi:hypothetical protein
MVGSFFDGWGMLGIGLQIFGALPVLGAVVYLCRILGMPTLRVVQFMIGYTPGKEPGEVVKGITHGLRILAWAAAVGLVMWFVFLR